MKPSLAALEGTCSQEMQVLSWVAQLCTSGLEVPSLEPLELTPALVFVP